MTATHIHSVVVTTTSFSDARQNLVKMCTEGNFEHVYLKMEMVAPWNEPDSISQSKPRLRIVEVEHRQIHFILL
jgi:hypothetical protein